MRGHIYFHCPCFDGIVSAALAWDFLESRQGWQDVSLLGVNYDLKNEWLAISLRKPAAVVDFLYHPDAVFWADHHPTTFQSDEATSDFQRRRSPNRIYDRSARSCAGLLWKHLDKEFDYRVSRYEEIIHWAEKTDSAGYESVDEAIRGDAPALRIAKSLALGDKNGYCSRLIEAIRQHSLSEVAALSEVHNRFIEVRNKTEAGLKRFHENVRMTTTIAVFDVESEDVIINRYAPFYFYPAARYSIGIVRWKAGAKITAMRNPWREFPSVFLGKIFERYGGGGHQRVASVLLKGEQLEQATHILNELATRIESEDLQANGDETP